MGVVEVNVICGEEMGAGAGAGQGRGGGGEVVRLSSFCTAQTVPAGLQSRNRMI